MGITLSKPGINIKVWNINCDRRLNGPIGQAFPKLHPDVRIPEILKKIKQELIPGTIFCLLEVTEEPAEKLRAFAKTQGYGCVSAPYNSSSGCFYFVTLYDQASFEVIKSTLLPLTKSKQPVSNDSRPKQGEKPMKEYLEETLGDNFEKGVFEVLFLNKQSGKQFVCYFNHLGLRNEARLKQTKCLIEYVQERNVTKGLPCFVGGDMNSFDFTKSTPTLFQEQIDLLTEAGLEWLTELLQSTFSAFPYDIVFKFTEDEKDIYFSLLRGEKLEEFRAFCEKMVEKYGTAGAALDHVFIKNFEGSCQVEIEPCELSDHHIIKTHITF